MQIYTVQGGDSLWRLAYQFGVTVEAIASANAVTQPTDLVIGESLVIPTAPDRYVVQPGDTLGRIAAIKSISVIRLAAANRIDPPYPLLAGQVLRLPGRNLPLMEVNGYLTDFGTIGVRTVRSFGQQMTYIAPFSHRVQADGTLGSLPDDAVLAAAKAVGCAPLLVITNFVGHMFSSDLAHALLTSRPLQNTLLTSVLKMMDSKGYHALNIDFEYVYPGDKDAYNQFLERVMAKLHAAGYLVSTALAPKDSANQPGLLYEAHDYPVHGRLCDFVVLMTYEWGYAAGPPWAIAPINEVERVLDYAVTAIPRDKILMGVPVYARDWKLPFVAGKTIAQTFDPQLAVDRAAEHGADIRFDELYQSPDYRYVDAAGSAHDVWFEDGHSIQVKLSTAQVYGLRGVSLWSLPSNFPQLWPVLADHLQLGKARLAR